MPPNYMNMRSRNWQFTMNYYVGKCIHHLLELNYRGLIFQEETAPTTGTPHLQGFIRFHGPKLGSEVKALFCTGDCDHQNTVHLEIAHHPEALVEYCRKGETRTGECYEEGDMTFEQGARKDWAELKDYCLTAPSFSEVLEQFPRECIMYERGIQRILTEAQRKLQPSWRDVRVYVIYGPTGYGKTRAAYEFDPDLYAVASPDAPGNVWFDDYKGQKTLLLDDFYGWIPYRSILRLLDGRPIRCQVKGSHCYPCWTTVVITSNDSPHKWYSHKFPSGCPPALCRRLNKGGVASMEQYKGDKLVELLRRGKRLDPIVPSSATAASPNFADITYDARTDTHTAPPAPVGGGHDMLSQSGGSVISQPTRVRDIRRSGTVVRTVGECRVGQRVEVDLTADEEEEEQMFDC